MLSENDTETAQQHKTKKLNLSFPTKIHFFQHHLLIPLYLKNNRGNCGEMTNAITLNVLNRNQSCSIACCPEGFLK